MNKNRFNWVLRTWLGAASLAAFAAGWVAFSHSNKPGVAGSTLAASSPGSAASLSNNEGEFSPLPTLAALPSVDPNTTLNIQPQVQSPISQNQFFQPRFRTRGS